VNTHIREPMPKNDCCNLITKDTRRWGVREQFRRRATSKQGCTTNFGCSYFLITATGFGGYSLLNNRSIPTGCGY
jgi:hypothetical protein